MRVTGYDQRSTLSGRWADFPLITNVRQRNDCFQPLDLFGCMKDSLEMGLLKAVLGFEGRSLLVPVLGE